IVEVRMAVMCVRGGRRRGYIDSSCQNHPVSTHVGGLQRSAMRAHTVLRPRYRLVTERPSLPVDVGSAAGSSRSALLLPRRLCLISDQHRDVANLVIGIRVAVRFGDLVKRISAPDHGAQLAGVDQLL